MSKIFLVTIEPVQQTAAEPGTLDRLAASLRAQVAERPEHTGPTSQIGLLTGWPLVRDPTLPPGYVYLRPTPQPDELHEGAARQ